MLYRDFGKTGWKVSAVGQGCWNIGNQWGMMSDEEADKILRTAYENGINLFDVAESYGIPTGLSEIRLGRSLAGIRDKVYIVSKIGWWGARTGQTVPKTTGDMIRLCGHACAGRLRTDWVDVMLCHEGGVQDPSVYLEGFEHLKKEGFIREYGISTDSLAVLERFYEMSGGNCAVVELEYSMVNRNPEKDILPYCREKGIAVLVRGPIAMGLLSGKYDLNTRFTDEVRSKWNPGEAGREAFEQKVEKVEKAKEKLKELEVQEDLPTVALRYVISHETAPVAIPGATSPRQVLGNVKAGERLLLPAEYAAIKAAL